MTDFKPRPSVDRDCGTCGSRHENMICSIGPEVTELLNKNKVIQTIQPGEILFHIGEDPKGLYSIASGLVKLETTSPQGAAHTLRILGPGGTLGYRSLFAQEKYHSSAVAIEKTEICFIPKALVFKFFNEHPNLAMKLLCHLSKDLKVAEEKWMDQMDKGAGERIAEALVFLQDHFQHQGWTRKEIAEWAGTTPETVIRTLAQFEKEGLIDQSTGRQIKIKNREKLREKVAFK